MTTGPKASWQSLIFFLCMSLLPLSTRAQSTDVRVNNTLVPTVDAYGVGVTQQETTLAVRSNLSAICVGFRDYGSQDRVNGFAFSTDGGASFTDGGALPLVPGGIRPFADPTLVLNSAGQFLFGSLRGGFAGLDLHVSSNCSSFAYAEPIVIGGGIDKEILAYDDYALSPNRGRTWAAWYDGGGTKVRYSDNAGSGVAWSATVEAVPAGANGYFPWPAVAPNEDLYVASMSGATINIAHRNASTGTWTARAAVTNASFAGESNATSVCGRTALKGFMRSQTLPQIQIHSDPTASVGFVIHAVWQADPDAGGPDISDAWYSRSTNGAVAPDAWSTPLRLNDDPNDVPRDQWNPALGVGATGIVAVSWYDRRLDPGNWWFDRYVRLSDDGGINWSRNLRVSDTSSPVARMAPHVDQPTGANVANCDHGDYDQVVVVGNTAHLVWSDARDVTTLAACPDNGLDPYYNQYCPNPDVYYDKVVLTDADADGVVDLLDTCKTYVNPRVGSGRTLVNGQRDGDGDGYGNACDPDYTNGVKRGCVAGLLQTNWGDYAWMNREM